MKRIFKKLPGKPLLCVLIISLLASGAIVIFVYDAQKSSKEPKPIISIQLSDTLHVINYNKETTFEYDIEVLSADTSFKEYIVVNKQDILNLINGATENIGSETVVLNVTFGNPPSRITRPFSWEMKLKDDMVVLSICIFSEISDTELLLNPFEFGTSVADYLSMINNN